MRNRYLLWTAFCLLISLSACMTSRGTSLRSIDTSKACAKWQWIGIKSPDTQDCPDIPGWKQSPLFSLPHDRVNASASKDYQHGDSGDLQTPDPEVTKELERFCVYTSKKLFLKLKALPFSPATSPKLVRFDQDCAAISPSAGMNLEANTWEILSGHFLSQVGRMDAPLSLKELPSVRLAFLDTQPKERTDSRFPQKPGISRHGYDLSQMARHLVCYPSGGKDRCAAWITTQLALPFKTFDPKSNKLSERDEEKGGLLGTWTDLAQAIEREIEAWHQEQGTKPSRHLILNVSVAWDPNLFGGLDEEGRYEMRAGTQAVYTALRYASASGALVLAAAGNQNYGPDATTGPLLPAGWESGILDEGSCREPHERPHVFAVGGVQSDGSPLANARRGGLPPRVAYADHAVVAAFDRHGPTPMYTGSSVATAVVSSIAAVVWNAHPELDARQVMEILDKSGNALPDLKADFWFDATSGAPRPTVHRLSLCTALREADCAATDSACRARFYCDWNQERAQLSPLVDPSAPVIKSTTTKVTPPLLPGLQQPCKAKKLFYLKKKHLSMCPADEFTGITSLPWLFPQPQDNPCPSCVVIPPPNREASLQTSRDLITSPTTYRLLGKVADDWVGCLNGATLDIERPDSSGKERITVTFPSNVCHGEDIDYTIDIGPLEKGTTVLLSSVQAPDGRTLSVESPVFIAK